MTSPGETRFSAALMDHIPPAATARTSEPFVIYAPGVPSAPLVLASPHSGRDYSAEFLAASRLDPLGLRRSEDSFVDELLADGPALGVPLLAANFPRAWCDPNREAWELDAGMFVDDLPHWVNSNSPRVGAGLGTIARIVSSGEAIYRRKLLFAEAEDRVRTCWRPYHDALAGLIGEAKAAFGTCLLIDCHSMPTASRGSTDIILGDAHNAGMDKLNRRPDASRKAHCKKAIVTLAEGEKLDFA